MYLLAPFFLQNFKKILNLRVDLELSGCAIFGPKNGKFFLNKIFLVQTIIIIFIYLLALFIVQNFKKILQRIQSYGDVPFLGPKWFICPKQTFFRKIINIIFNLPISRPFHCAKFKKNSCSGSRVMRMRNFWAQNDPFPQMKIFSENLLVLMSLVYFIHACLHVKNQSQILIY